MEKDVERLGFDGEWSVLLLLANERDSQWEIAFRNHHHCVVTSFRVGAAALRKDFGDKLSLLVGNVAGGDGDLGDVVDLDSLDLAKNRLVGPIEEKCCAATIVSTCSTSTITNFWLRMLWGLWHESVVVVKGQHYINLNLICYNHTFSVQFCISLFLSLHNVKYIILTFKQIFHKSSIL